MEEEKDSRKQRKLKEERRNHHKGHVLVGPDILVKKGNEKKSEPDPFGVGCSGVSHSLNKDKRWEKVEQAEEILEEKMCDSTFIKAHVSIKSGNYLVPTQACVVDSIHVEKGGYTSVTTVRNGKVETRKAKSDKSKLHMLTDGDTYESSSTTYTAITLKDGGPKMVERGWRRIQPYRVHTVEQRLTKRKGHEGERNDSRQDELEQQLDESYERKMETAESTKMGDN
ncbi:hypothetical protein PFISCL1PPCAC_2583 [Pristionchus fissidentatus]|uniref:Uncharacterized protein n=1 Tax=Pristionchus fissidentatus TaxID=1538716 RepID=A0AAV5UXP9_9BILA|nr:hypothetical protein PFISCL1PPCAC_2583 [Pristionchus fissidentatus]